MTNELSIMAAVVVGGLLGLGILWLIGQLRRRDKRALEKLRQRKQP